MCAMLMVCMGRVDFRDVRYSGSITKHLTACEPTSMSAVPNSIVEGKRDSTICIVHPFHLQRCYSK